MESLTVKVRETPGKSDARKMRRQGLIPGVLYHHGDPSMNVFVEERALRKVCRTTGPTGLVELQFDADVKTDLRRAIYKEIQLDHLSVRILHVDLQGVRAGEKVTIEVPVRLNGQPAGVLEDGGVLVQQIKNIQIRCLPEAIPARLEIDVSALRLHENLAAKSLKLPDGVELYHVDADAILASITDVRKLEEPVKAAAEGEVVEGAEGAAAPGAEGAAAPAAAGAKGAPAPAAAGAKGAAAPAKGAPAAGAKAPAADAKGGKGKK